MDLTTTPIFVAIFAMMYVPLTMLVGARRGATDIRYLDGGDEDLLRRIRGHGNFAENVPIALLAMAAAEISGAPQWLIISGGVVLLAARIVHYGNARGTGWGMPRMISMILTLLPIAVFALATFYYRIAA